MYRVIAVLVLLLAFPANAVEPTERLADPLLEAQAREISKELRCVVCQNQSIDDSDAQIAQDLRKIVRERLAAGDDEEAIKAYLVERYGEFVLFRPEFSFRNAVLWFAPLLFAVAVIIGVSLRRRKPIETPSAPVEPLSEDEQKRLDEILGQTSQTPR